MSVAFCFQSAIGFWWLVSQYYFSLKFLGYLLQLLCVCVYLCVQSCPALCDPCRLSCGISSGSIRGISQARTLEWVAISSSRGSSSSGIEPTSFASCLGRWVVDHSAAWKPRSCFSVSVLGAEPVTRSVCLKWHGTRRKSTTWAMCGSVSHLLKGVNAPV